MVFYRPECKMILLMVAEVSSTWQFTDHFVNLTVASLLDRKLHGFICFLKWIVMTKLEYIY